MKRHMRISLALLCLLVLLGSMLGFMACGSYTSTNTNGGLATGSPVTTVVDCSTATPQQIVDGIYDALSKSTYASQQWQFNVTAATKTVTIIGWSKDNQAIIDLVKKTATGCSYETSNFLSAYCDLGANYRVINSCTAGYFPCGDICIPIGDYCKITASEAPANGNTNVCANSKTTADTYTNTNSNGTGNTKTSTKAP